MQLLVFKSDAMREKKTFTAEYYYTSAHGGGGVRNIGLKLPVLYENAPHIGNETDIKPLRMKN